MDRRRLFVIIVVGVVVCAAALMIVMGLLSKKEPKQVDKHSELSYYIPGDYFVTNVVNSRMLLKTNVSLGFDKKTMDSSLLKEQQSAIRDIINRELRTLSESDLAEPTVLDTLKVRLMARLREEMGYDNLNDILFTDFVAQG